MMHRTEAEGLVRELLSEHVDKIKTELAGLAPDERLPARLRRQAHLVIRWEAIAAGEPMEKDDLPAILGLIQEQLAQRRLVHRIATGPFANFVDEATALVSVEWQRLSDVELALRLPEAAARLSY